MNLVCKFRHASDPPRVGLLADGSVLLDLMPQGVLELEQLLESKDPVGLLQRLNQASLPRIPLEEVSLCAPVDRQEVWAAGVTYLRSKAARMEESQFSATSYDRVYDAERPELFFKSIAEKVVGPEHPASIRKDATWSVPEPELALVLNSRAEVAGYTIGNDMSARDIEGDNLLYLPQAKIYRGSCALGPWIRLGVSEEEARQWQIRLRIEREERTIFAGETSATRIKRSFDELVRYLFRSQNFPHGAILLTGTGVVPPDSFSLKAEDLIEIQITGIGTLRNRVTVT